MAARHVAVFALWVSLTALAAHADSYRIVHHFSGSEGALPAEKLATDGVRLYGACSVGGRYGAGTVFSLRPDGLDFRVLHHFKAVADDGVNPSSTLVLCQGRIYGTTSHGGGSLRDGTLYSMLPDGTDYRVVHAFEFRDSYDGAPVEDREMLPGGVMSASDTTVYFATTYSRYAGGFGSIYGFNVGESNIQLVVNFTNPLGSGVYPSGAFLHAGHLFTTTRGVEWPGGFALIGMNVNGLDAWDVEVMHVYGESLNFIYMGPHLFGDADLVYGIAWYSGIVLHNSGLRVFILNYLSGDYEEIAIGNDASLWGRGGPITKVGGTLFAISTRGGIYDQGMIVAVDESAVDRAYTTFEPAPSEDEPALSLSLWHVRGSQGQNIAWMFGKQNEAADVSSKGLAKGPGDCLLAVTDPSWSNVWSCAKLGGMEQTWAFGWGYAGTVPVRGDYDGDGIADLAVYDAAAGSWYVRSLLKGCVAWSENWGYGGTQPVPGDYDGDGKSDLAVYDPVTGDWFIRTLAGTCLAWQQPWGYWGAEPVPGDYDGDGRDDLAVYDRDTGRWFILSLTSGVLAWDLPWGYAGAVPVSGDYDGDGVSDLAVYDAAAGMWYVTSLKRGCLVWGLRWGFPEGIAVSGDYDADGVSDFAICDGRNGLWYVGGLSRWPIASGESWGFTGATLLSGDFTGDGAADACAYDPSTGNWYVKRLFHAGASRR